MYVLIVDDAKPKKELLRMMVEKIFHNEQVHLSWAKNFTYAKNRIENGDAYSVILLDGDLKDLAGDGIDLIKEIKKSLHLAGAKIIMTTDSPLLLEKAKKEGVSLSITTQDLEDLVVNEKMLPLEIMDVFNKYKLEMSHSSH